MTCEVVYYNEHDPKAAAWLRELMADGVIPQGEVDERSIVDVRADDLRGYAQCHFFAGIGGWAYALRLAGWADDRPVWTGSCPCQPFSVAGKGLGADDPRHLWPAWFRLIRECRPHVIFGEQVEAAVGHGWLDLVSDDLEGEGYAVGSVCLPAASVGAPHKRDRLWFVAQSSRAERGSWWTGRDEAIGRGARAEPSGSGDVGELAHAEHAERRTVDGPGEEGRHRSNTGREEAHGDPGTRGQVRDVADPRPEPKGCAEAGIASHWADAIWLPCRDGKARLAQPGIFPLVDGLSRGVGSGSDSGLSDAEVNATAEARVMRLRGYGNAIVPQVAAAFIHAYLETA